jgi:hypothetical protein
VVAASPERAQSIALAPEETMLTLELDLCEIDEREDESFAPMTMTTTTTARTRDAAWTAVHPYPFETCRWERAGGAWISVALNLTPAAIAVIVTADDGRRTAVDSLEEALATARTWMAA